MLHVPLLVEIALHKSLHVSDASRAGVPAKDLQIHSGKMMVGIGIKLPLKFCQRLHLNGGAGRIGITLSPGQSINARVYTLQRTQHVVE